MIGCEYRAGVLPRSGTSFPVEISRPFGEGDWGDKVLTIGGTSYTRRGDVRRKHEPSFAATDGEVPSAGSVGIFVPRLSWVCVLEVCYRCVEPLSCGSLSECWIWMTTTIMRKYYELVSSFVCCLICLLVGLLVA